MLLSSSSALLWWDRMTAVAELGVSLPPGEELCPVGGDDFSFPGQLGSDETPAGWALIE